MFSCTEQLDISYLQAHNPSCSLCRPGFKTTILSECWFWRLISTTTIIMFLACTEGSLARPHLRASPSEKGHMSILSMFKSAFRGSPVFVDKSPARVKFIKVLSKQWFCLQWPHFTVQGLFGCDHYIVWQSSAHTGPGRGINQNLDSDWLR